MALLKEILRIVLFLCFLGQSLTAQVRFFAESDARQIIADNFFRVSFTLENSKGSSFVPPSFKDFEVVSGPSQSTQMTIINGRSSQKISYSYTLTSSKIGKFTIGPATIMVDNKKLETKSLEIEVLESNKSISGSTVGEDFILKTQVSHDTGYVGQQITLKYILYTTKDVRSFNFTSFPEFDGFYAEEIQNYSDRAQREIRNGVQYVKRAVKAVALYPQQKGSFSIPKVTATLGVSDGRPRSSFFFNTRLKQTRVRSDEVNILITELPRGAPESFSGAVGDFYMGTAVDKKSLTTDDALTLTLQVRGFGDTKFVQAPTQPYDDLFDVYEPNLLAEETKVVGDKVQLTKTYEYLMIPKKAGTLKFKPELTYYDPDSMRYRRLIGQEYVIRVAQGSDVELQAKSNKGVVLPPIFAKTALKRKGRFFAFSTLHWSINGALALAGVAMLLVRRIQVREERIDPAIKRMNKAQKIAIQKLSQAKAALDESRIKDFYILLRQGLLDYLADKTNQPSSQLSKDAVTQILKDRELESLCADTLNILEKGEQAIYAFAVSGEENSIYENALSIIQKIETSLNKVK